MNKIIITFFLLISISHAGIAQNESENEHEEINLLITDSTWVKEIFPFPIRFAQDINYKGIEEAQFPKGWSKKESPYFWSYVFVWNIEGNKVNSVKDLETDLKTYFDGLMGTQDAIVNFTEKNSSNKDASYTGKASFFDNLRTKTPISLNVQVRKQYCQQADKSFIVFRFSPKEFEHEIWRISFLCFINMGTIQF